MTAFQMFEKACAKVEAEFCEAGADEKLRAAIGLTDLALRQESEEFNRKRWENQNQQAVDELQAMQMQARRTG